eukprot:m.768507 g.768507  ORF g.768507 m.768507 type:complete len:316 (-) comp23228_c0_seq1:141-1088(-)
MFFISVSSSTVCMRVLASAAALGAFLAPPADLRNPLSRLIGVDPGVDVDPESSGADFWGVVNPLAAYCIINSPLSSTSFIRFFVFFSRNRIRSLISARSVCSSVILCSSCVCSSLDMMGAPPAVLPPPGIDVSDSIEPARLDADARLCVRLPSMVDARLTPRLLLPSDPPSPASAPPPRSSSSRCTFRCSSLSCFFRSLRTAALFLSARCRSPCFSCTSFSRASLSSSYCCSALVCSLQSVRRNMVRFCVSRPQGLYTPCMRHIFWTTDHLISNWTPGSRFKIHQCQHLQTSKDSVHEFKSTLSIQRQLRRIGDC